MMIYLDFESYAIVDIKKRGRWFYNNHIDTETICCAFSIDGGWILWRTLLDGSTSWDMDDVFERVKSGEKVAAWSAGFEYTLWNAVCVPKYGWPALKIEQMFDVQALAMSFGLPASLGECAKVLGLAEQKDESGRTLMKLSKPDSKGCRIPYESAREEYTDFFRYCVQDVRTLYAIHKAFGFDELSPKEQRLWVETERMNQAGVPVDLKTAMCLKAHMDKFNAKLFERFEQIANIPSLKKPTQVQELKKYVEDLENLELEDLNADTVKSLLKDPELRGTTRDLLFIRKLTSRTSVKKYDRLIQMADDDQNVHDILRYHKATTGRWGGAGFQIHNLPRTKVKKPNLVAYNAATMPYEEFLAMYSDPVEVGKSMLRSLIKARPGYKFTVVDFSSIEARILVWLAGDERTLELYRNQVDVYKWFATKLYPVDYENVTDAQRDHAKRCILGLGYMMGWKKYKETCEGYGVYITDHEAQRDVNLYRDTFANTVELWDELYNIAIWAVQNKLPRQLHQGEVYTSSNFLHVRLPSGRSISYYKPRVEMVETPWGAKRLGITSISPHPKTKKWGRYTLPPNRMIENTTQAIGRDLLADAVLRLIDHGYNVLFHVHDEIISHDPLGFGSLEQMSMIMCDTDRTKYAGLPIDVEGFVTERYKK